MRSDGGRERRLSLAAGEILFRQGDDFSVAFLVESGRIETYRERSDGPDEPRARYGPGESFGLPAPLNPGSRSESARALETTVLLACDPQTLRTKGARTTAENGKSK